MKMLNAHYREACRIDGEAVARSVNISPSNGGPFPSERLLQPDEALQHRQRDDFDFACDIRFYSIRNQQKLQQQINITPT